MNMNIENLRKKFESYESSFDYAPITGRILNLTQHSLTKEQIAQGAFEPSKEDKLAIAKILTVESLDSPQQLIEKSLDLLEVASKYQFDYLLVGGMHPLIRTLEHTLQYTGVLLCQAFSQRIVVEEKGVDGTTVKKTVFVHEKFYRFC